MAPWIAPGLCQNRGEQMSKFLNLKKTKTEFVSLYLFFCSFAPLDFAKIERPQMFSRLCKIPDILRSPWSSQGIQRRPGTDSVLWTQNLWDLL